jgi:hypothetical protein
MRHPIVLLLLATASSQCLAQDAAAINQRLGGCEAQKAAAPRAKCFELLARDAIAMLDQLASAPTPNQAKDLTPAPVPAQSPAPSSQYAEFIAKAKANLTSSMRDPASVQWKGLFISKTGAQSLCGEINGKNAYGAYVGFMRFYATTEKLLSEIESAKDNFVFNKMWPKLCGEELVKVDQN